MADFERSPSPFWEQKSFYSVFIKCYEQTAASIFKSDACLQLSSDHIQKSLKAYFEKYVQFLKFRPRETDNAR